MASPPTVPKVLFVGHSHVKHLALFMNARPKFQNFGFDASVVVCDFLGIGGLKLKDLVRQSDKGSIIFDKIDSFKPDILVFWIGDNDITDTSIENLCLSFSQLISSVKLRFPALRKLVFLQLLPRYGNNAENYNIKAAEVMSQLVRRSRSTNNEDLWIKYCRFHFPCTHESRFVKQAKFFKKDGVHLTPAGNYKAYSGIKEVVIHSIKKF